LIKAAAAPEKPPAPQYDPDNSDMTQIRLLFIPPDDNGGADITNYELWYDEVTSASNF